MKRLLPLALALLALNAHAQQAPPPKPSSTTVSTPTSSKLLLALDAANGVGNSRFGADRSTFSRLVQTDVDGAMVYYKRSKDHLPLGPLVLHEVLYGFYHDKLALIRLQTPDEASSQAALRELVARYGYEYRAIKLPQRPGPLERLTWVGNRTTLIYTLNTADKDATILFFSNAMAEQRLQEKAGTAK